MIKFLRHSGIYTLKAQQELNLPIEKAWDFFSSPGNLEKITPSFMGFKITSEQRFGPYKMWHHEHFFKALPNGKTLMEDKISYKIPFGILGHLAQRLFIKKQLTHIFDYRKETLNKMFND